MGATTPQFLAPLPCYRDPASSPVVEHARAEVRDDEWSALTEFISVGPTVFRKGVGLIMRATATSLAQIDQHRYPTVRYEQGNYPTS